MEAEIVFDPSNLHLRKELTQIKKAAKVLRDPGTTSSWRSPLSTARSAMQVSNSSKQHFDHNHNNNLHQFKYDSMVNGKQVSRYIIGSNNGFVDNDCNKSGNGCGKNREKEKKVYLYNWKMQRSESEKSRQVDDVNGDAEGSVSTPEESVEYSWSDARNGGNDSKSDPYVGDRYGSLIFNCKDTNFTPSIRRSAKKRSKRNGHSISGLRNHNNKVVKQILPNKGSKGVLENLPGMGLEKDDSSSLVYRSDDADDHCNLDELKKGALTSPLLARLTNRDRGRWSTKLMRDSRKDDSSYTYSTPALSTSSFKKYYLGNPSTVGSWVATTASLNDVDDDSDDPLDLPGREGCGIPCYWSKRSTPKSRGGYASGFSPSLSDTLRRKGSSILCGRHSKYQKRQHRYSLSYGKRNISSRNAGQGTIPLLINSVDGHGGSSMGTGNSDDELSTNYGELDLEAVNRLDGRRWSTSCRSQDGLELITFNGEAEGEGSGETVKSLSHKYRPMFFEEMIGQNIVIQSFTNAVSKGRIAPVYLFQGPRGTGKTSTARIFAVALNCLASEETKPCGVCRECAEYISGKRRDIREIDGASKKAIDRIKHLLKNLSVASASSRYQVFVIDECHLLPAKAWVALLKFLQEPPQRIVFVLITTDLDNLPCTILSRCQKYIFIKIRDSDIAARLRKIATEENLDAESDALDLIALNADGSLRDAETMLEQLSLFGKTITTSLVNELVGVVSDEKLLELLELALSSDTVETVKRARELLDSGVDPIVLMSQLASVIMDIIAGTHPNVDAAQSGSFFRGGSLTNIELERLKHALKLLSDAEKQLRVSSERSTWFTATLLQLGSLPTLDRTHSGSSRRQSSKATDEDPSSTYREATSLNQRPHGPRMSESPNSFPPPTHCKSSSKEVPYTRSDGISSKSNLNQSGDGRIFSASQDYSVNETITPSDSQILENIWARCIEKCHSKTLRRLLHTHGKLVSISQVKGVFVAYIAFSDSDIKTRVERFLSSITNAFEYVLRNNVVVNIVMLPDGWTSVDPVRSSPQNQKHLGSTSHINGDGVPIGSKVDAHSDMDSQQESLKISKGSFGNSDGILNGLFESTDGTSGSNERKSEIPVQRIESIIHEQRLETAWLQAMEKGTPGSLSRLKPERHQILPQDGSYHQNQMESMNSLDFPTQHLEDELNNELKNLKIVDAKVFLDDQIIKKDHLPLTPSLLHDTNVACHLDKESMGYESGAGASGCSGLFCWNNRKPHRRMKVKQGTPVHPHRAGRFLLFGECAKPRRSGNRKRQI